MGRSMTRRVVAMFPGRREVQERLATDIARALLDGPELKAMAIGARTILEAGSDGKRAMAPTSNEDKGRSEGRPVGPA